MSLNSLILQVEVRCVQGCKSNSDGIKSRLSLARTFQCLSIVWGAINMGFLHDITEDEMAGANIFFFFQVLCESFLSSIQVHPKFLFRGISFN